MFTQEQIIDLKSKINIFDFYSQFLTLKQCGKYYRAVCPFHNDHTPSFDVSSETGLWICRSCGASGDIIDFYRRYNDKSFFDAVMEIAKSQNIEIELSDEVKKEYELKRNLYKINDKIATYFQKSLLKSDIGKEYMKQRQFSVDTIKKWKLGYIPYKSLVTSNEAMNQLLEQGNLIKRTEDDGYRNYFGSYRISIPFFNENGKIVGFSSRAVNNEIKPKYLHSQNSLLFKKDEVLFGYNFAKETIKTTKCVIICEGQVDCIMAHQNGITNVVATCGLALSDKQLSLLKADVKNYFLIVEDKAGEGAVDRLYDTIIQNNYGANVRIVRLYDNVGDKMDLDELLRTQGKGELYKRLKGSKIYNEDKIIRSLDKINYKTIDEKKFHIYNVRKYISKIKDSLTRNQYIQMLADKLELPEVDVKRICEKTTQSHIEVGEIGSRKDKAQQTIIASLFSKFGYSIAYNLIKELKIPNKLNNSYRKIFDKIENVLLMNGTNCDLINILHTCDLFEEGEKRTIDQAYFLSEQFDNLDDEDELKECLEDQVRNLR